MMDGEAGFDVTEAGRALGRLLVGTGLAAVLGLAYTIYVGRALGPTAFSSYAVAVSLVYLLTIIAGPLNDTVTRFTSELAQRGERGRIRALLRSIRRFNLKVGAAFLIAGIGLTPMLAAFLQLEYSLVASALVVGYLVFALNGERGGFRGCFEFRAYNRNVVIEAGLRLLSGIILLSVAATATAAMGGYLAAALVALLLARQGLGRLTAGHEPEAVDIGPFLRFGVGTLLFVLGIAGLQNIDMLLVKHYLTEYEAGVYGASVMIGRSVLLLAIPFRVVALPAMSVPDASGAAVASPLSLSVRYLALSLPPVAFLWIWPDRVLELLYGSEYSDGAGVLPILGAAFMIGGLTVLVAQRLVSRSEFGFVWALLSLLLVEIVALAVYHGSLLTISLIVVITQILALITTATFALRSRSRP